MPKLRKSAFLALPVLLACSFLLGVLLFLKAWKGLPTEHLTRDPNALFDAPLYIGFLSQVGLFIWSAAAMACLYSGLLIPRNEGTAEARHFLWMSGGLLMLLGLDDAFLLHEQFFPFIGIPEKAVYGIYAGLMLFLLVRFHALILRSEYPLLAAGLACLGLSVSLDWLQPEQIDIFLIEDGGKLMGILSWLAYFSHTAFTLTRKALADHAFLQEAPAATDDAEDGTKSGAKSGARGALLLIRTRARAAG